MNRRARPFLPVAAVLMLVAAPWHVHAAPVFEMQLLPKKTRAQLGDSLVFELRFTNVSHRPARLWLPIHPNRIVRPELRLRVQPRAAREIVLTPGVLFQMLYSPEDTDFVTLEPGEATGIRWCSAPETVIRTIGVELRLGTYLQGMDYFDHSGIVPASIVPASIDSAPSGTCTRPVR